MVAPKASQTVPTTATVVGLRALLLRLQVLIFVHSGERTVVGYQLILLASHRVWELLKALCLRGLRGAERTAKHGIQHRNHEQEFTAAFVHEAQL